MADFNPTSGKSRKSRSPRVDMTPMVDLGFLLITFFILATTLAKPKSIQIVAPAKATDMEQPPLKCSKSITLLLDQTDKVKFYTCPDNPQVDSATYSKQGIRQVLLNRQKEVQQQWGDKNNLIALVKTAPNAKYGRMVNVIDEMHITNTLFTIAEMEAQDSTILKLH